MQRDKFDSFLKDVKIIVNLAKRKFDDIKEEENRQEIIAEKTKRQMDHYPFHLKEEELRSELRDKISTLATKYFS